MKFDICSRTINYVCDDPKYCCKPFQMVIESGKFNGTFDITDYGKVRIRNRYDYHDYLFDGDNKNIYAWESLQLNYCPFCGEKIE